MYNYMGRSNKTLLIIVSITTLCLRCYGTTSSIAQTNWRNAHMHCKKEGKMLPNLHKHTLSNETYFWTGHYTRVSELIKIIGCFEDTVVNTLTKKSQEMYFPSAGRCQEVCLASSYSVFGVQLNKCVCLEHIPGQGSRGANECSSSCSGKYSHETSIKFQKDCGGNQTFNLFKSGSEMENSAFTTTDCLSIQCISGAKTFIKMKCNTDYSQICNKTFYAAYKHWRPSSEDCKSMQNSYLFGDVNLTDPVQACTFIQGKPFGPSWIGIAKELYIGIDGVIDDMVHNERNPTRCLKCNSDNCTFADCKESHYFVCLETQGTTSTTPTGITTSTTPHGIISTSTSTSSTGSTKSITPHGTVSTSTTPTATENATVLPSNKKESMKKNQDDNTTVIIIVVPVTVIITFGLIALLLVTLWKRRQTKKTAETRNDQHSEKNDTNHSLQNNYFVLEKTETYSKVNSTRDATDKDFKTSNACYDDYDHLGENFIKKDEEDTYHHAFFPNNEEESDYGIRNISDECQKENPYSHTNTGAYQVALAENEHNTSSIDA